MNLALLQLKQTQDRHQELLSSVAGGVRKQFELGVNEKQSQNDPFGYFSKS